MLFFPNAKINIGLHILNRRNDGFHNIETVFVPVGLCDVLEFVPSDSLQFSSTGIEIDSPAEKNLCMRAYDILRKDFLIPPVEIHLHKVIPLGAGLGGGSSDGAFMLKFLNNYFELNLSDDELCRYASMLGSDCAFFIRNEPLFAFERGNIFKNIKRTSEEMIMMLVYPGIHVSTAEAYAGIVPKIPAYSIEEAILHPVGDWRNFLVNDFEETVFKKYPLLESIKKEMYRLGAVYASMSGSGSAIYGLFNEVPESNLSEKYFTWQGKITI